MSVAVEAQKNRPAGPVSSSKSAGAALAQAAQVYRQQSDKPQPLPDELSFETLFKMTAQPVVVEDVPA